MSNLSTAMSLVLAAGMLVAALLSIVTRSLPLAILSAGGGGLLSPGLFLLPAAPGAVSLFASIMFMLLAAPDVAMTEAAIGSGLTTFLFFFVLGRVGGKGHG